MKRVFFDASVLFSAIYSSYGGSYALVRLALKGEIMGVTTKSIIEELYENMHKIKKASKQRVDIFIQTHKLMVRERMTHKEIEQYIGLVEEKDTHVVVGALLSHCDFLVTLDKKHLDNVETKKLFNKQIHIVSPKELLRLV